MASPVVAPLERAPIPIPRAEILSRPNNYFGRSVRLISEVSSHTAHAIQYFAVKTLQLLNGIKNDCDALAKLLRGAGYMITGLKECGISVLPKLASRGNDAVNLIDSVQILGDIQYFFTGQYKDDSAPQFIGRVFLGAADVGGLVLWAEELGFGLSRAADAVGKVRCFSFVPLIPFANIVTGFVGVGFAFMGADAVWRLVKTRNTTEAEDINVNVKRIKAILDLSWCGLELVGKVILIAAALSLIPMAPTAIIATLGVLAAFMGLTSFAYGLYNKDRLNDEAKISDMLR